jgi:hypothetical protein
MMKVKCMQLCCYIILTFSHPGSCLCATTAIAYQSYSSTLVLPLMACCEARASCPAHGYIMQLAATTQQQCVLLVTCNDSIEHMHMPLVPAERWCITQHKLPAWQEAKLVPATASHARIHEPQHALSKLSACLGVLEGIASIHVSCMHAGLCPVHIHALAHHQYLTPCNSSHPSCNASTIIT